MDTVHNLIRLEHLAGGRVDLILADSEMKRRLTHDCQFCSQKFQQVSNLVNHLLQHHSELADAGEQYRQVLQKRFAPRGCCCMPRIKQFRSTHMCVLFHQMSMIHFNGNALLHIPLVYDDTARDRMDTHVPMKSYLLVHDALKSRDFELLQQDPHFRNVLCTQCLCCGKQVTLTGPSKEHLLRHHLITMHPEPQQAIQSLIQMVIDRKGHDHLTTCDWCGVSIVPTHANNEYDDHLAECPALLHFATWLLIPLTPLTHGNRSGGLSQPNSGCAGSIDGLRGTKRPLHEETQDSSNGIKAAFERQRFRQSGARPLQSADIALSIDSASRKGFEQPSSTEHIHPLPVDGSQQPDAPTSPNKCNVEAATGETSGHTVSTAMPDPQPASNSDPAGHQSHGIQEGGPVVAVERAEQAHPSGLILAIPEMGSFDKDLGAGCQMSKHQHEGDDADPRAALQENGQTHIRHQVPCIAEQNEAGASHSVAFGAGYEGSPATCPVDDVGEQQCVATHSSSSQTASSTTIPLGRRPYEAHMQEIDRWRYGHIMSQLVLVNADVQCYVNATFLTIMWTHLMCCDFNGSSWGELTTTFLGIVMEGQTLPLSLWNHSQLQSGFAQWQQLRGESSTTQQDYSEFLHYFLSWISAQTTSRRFVHADVVKTVEKSDAFAPILLHSDLWNDLPHPVQLQTVLNQWHQSNGMIQALEQASHIVCFQICRFQTTTLLDRTAIELGSMRATLPVFTDSRLAIASVPYQVAALVHYHGDSTGGHYNCVIAHLDKYGDLVWLFHDDNCKPIGWKLIPEWFLYDVTHVWMVRSDKYQPWKPASEKPLSQEHALATVLAHLRDP